MISQKISQVVLLISAILMIVFFVKGMAYSLVSSAIVFSGSLVAFAIAEGSNKKSE